MQRAFTNFRQNKKIDNTLRENSLIEKATNHKNNYDLQNAFSNLKHNMFLKDEIKNNNDELQRNLPKIIENINNNNDTSSEINKIEPSVLSEKKPSFLNNITSEKFKLKKVETENTNPILDTSKASFLGDITSGKFKLKIAEPKTTNPILDTPRKRINNEFIIN